jgi:hypothetical protein
MPALACSKRAAMYVPIAVTKQPQINAAIADVVRELSPSVLRISYEIAQDWSGQWAIFFRVLLSDEASRRDHLRDVAGRVVSRMSDRLDLPGLGLFPYFAFRSQAEQIELNEPAWA